MDILIYYDLIIEIDTYVVLVKEVIKTLKINQFKKILCIYLVNNFKYLYTEKKIA